MSEGAFFKLGVKLQILGAKLQKIGAKLLESGLMLRYVLWLPTQKIGSKQRLSLTPRLKGVVPILSMDGCPVVSRSEKKDFPTDIHIHCNIL